MTLVRIHGKPTFFMTLTDMSLVIKKKDCETDNNYMEINDVIKAEVSESMPKMNMAEEECMGTLPTQNSNHQVLHVSTYMFCESSTIMQILLQEHKLWKDYYKHVRWGYLRAVSTICGQIQSMPGGCGRTALYLLLSRHAVSLTRLMGSATNYRWRVVPPYYNCRDEEQGMGGSCQHVHAAIQYE